MSTPAPKPRGLARLLAWRRFVVVLIVGAFVGLLQSPAYETTPTYNVMSRTMLMGIVQLMAFGIFEQWPARLPGWIARWALQICAVALVMPWAVFAFYVATTAPDQPFFWYDPLRRNGFFTMTTMGLLVGPWVAIVALFRQREIQLRSQSEAFALERSELERKALDARLRLLQAQVEPHFLFNTDRKSTRLNSSHRT